MLIWMHDDKKNKQQNKYKTIIKYSLKMIINKEIPIRYDQFLAH